MLSVKQLITFTAIYKLVTNVIPHKESWNHKDILMVIKPRCTYLHHILLFEKFLCFFSYYFYVFRRCVYVKITTFNVLFKILFKFITIACCLLFIPVYKLEKNIPRKALIAMISHWLECLPANKGVGDFSSSPNSRHPTELSKLLMKLSF